MTRARAIELLKGVQFCCDLDDCTNAWDCEECDDALNMAIKALEQEQERQEVIYECPNCLGNYICYPSCGIKEQERLPKHCIVPPSDAVGVPKSGKWVKKEHLGEFEEYWHCSECDYEGDRQFRPSWKYCPNCGARMESE